MSLVWCVQSVCRMKLFLAAILPFSSCTHLTFQLAAVRQLDGLFCWLCLGRSVLSFSGSRCVAESASMTTGRPAVRLGIFGQMVGQLYSQLYMGPKSYVK